MQPALRPLPRLGAQPQQRHRPGGERQRQAEPCGARPILALQRKDFMKLRPRQPFLSPGIDRCRRRLRRPAGSGKATQTGDQGGRVGHNVLVMFRISSRQVEIVCENHKMGLAAPRSRR